MRFTIALMWFLLLAPAAALAKYGPTMLIHGRCHMDECSFTEIVATKTVGARTGGALISAVERSAVVKAP
ncbi:MAG TPA: hypothetical protein VN919_06170, partial [Xanthobacteraceae bacterium]|nr:hypothetical protein [Xanthobacteraceae bacterium]